MRNRLKEILSHGETALGMTVCISHPFIAEAVGKVGFDFINFDTQHSPMSMEKAEQLLEAMSYSQTTPLIRVEWNDFAAINHALDIGAHGVIVPFINTKEDAKKSVKYSSYPHRGIRSYGPMRAILRDPDYMLMADEEILVLPQIEAKEGLDNIESILSVNGIEAFFVGPYDLSRSLGVWTQWNHPKFQKALERILQVADETSTVPGMLAPFEDIKKTIERGYRLISIGADFSFFNQAVSSAYEMVASYKGQTLVR